MLNQFVAMFIKKFMLIINNWQSCVVELISVLGLLLILMMQLKMQNFRGNLPAMPLDLSKFTDSVTLLQINSDNQEYLKSYKKVLSEYGYSTAMSADIIEEIINLVSRSMIIKDNKLLSLNFTFSIKRFSFV